MLQQCYGIWSFVTALDSMLQSVRVFLAFVKCMKNSSYNMVMGWGILFIFYSISYVEH
jgi:hypothetical protein